MIDRLQACKCAGMKARRHADIEYFHFLLQFSESGSEYSYASINRKQPDKQERFMRIKSYPRIITTDNSDSLRALNSYYLRYGTVSPVSTCRVKTPAVLKL